MQSSQTNAVWASQTSSQTVGLNNWAQYQLSLQGSSYKFQINSAATTSTNLQYYTNREGVDIIAGDSILLSTNGSTFTSGTAGVVNFVAGAATQLSSTGFNNQLTPNLNANLTAGSPYMSPDGRNFYTSALTNSNTRVTIYQFALSTPFDITTLTYTGKSAFVTKAATNSNPDSFTFKPDGSILYVSLSNGATTSNTFRSYALSTAWDITTIGSSPNSQVTLTYPSTTSPWGVAAGGAGYGLIQFSPDGTRLICCNTNSYTNSTSLGGNLAIYNLSVPWVAGSLTLTSTNWTNSSQAFFGTSSAVPFGCWFTPDGRKIIWGATNASGQVFVVTLNLGAAWTLGNGLTTFAINSVSNSGMFVTTVPRVQAYFDANGTNFIVNQADGTGARVISSGNDLYGKYNVNISGFSLGSAPTFAYNAAPTVRVDAETTAARISLFPYQTYMASSTTSQAVIYKPTSGYVIAGDTILLNGTTPVVTTSVTEGTNLGVAAVPISTAANRTYASKTFGLPTTSFVNSIRISPDGGTLIAGLRLGTYGTGLYQYTLTTPFDINTATFQNKFALCNQDGIAWTNGIAFDITPDGSRLILLGGYLSGQTSSASLIMREYTMLQNWDITTLNPTNVTWSTSLTNSSAVAATCVRFVPNGTQFVWVYNDVPNAGSTNYVYYVNLGTAYRISTASAGPGTLWASTVSTVGAVQSVTFTPDGLNIITQGLITVSNTLGTANNMATATTTNNPNSGATRWAWPAGTMGSSAVAAYGGEFSPDGTKYYVINGDGNNVPTGYNNIWQFNVMVIPQTSYTCNFATQGSAPTSIVIPDRSVAQSITTSLSGGNMVFASSAVGTNARAIATKITAPGNYTTVTNATFTLTRS